MEQRLAVKPNLTIVLVISKKAVLYSYLYWLLLDIEGIVEVQVKTFEDQIPNLRVVVVTLNFFFFGIFIGKRTVVDYFVVLIKTVIAMDLFCKLGVFFHKIYLWSFRLLQ